MTVKDVLGKATQNAASLVRDLSPRVVLEPISRERDVEAKRESNEMQFSEVLGSWCEARSGPSVLRR